jgi:ribonuclease HII
MALFEQGYSFIAGLDEAGRGCLAGPVVAAAVILPLSPANVGPGLAASGYCGVPGCTGNNLLSCLMGVRDSKQLSEAQRERLFDAVTAHALAIGVGIVSVEEIDRRNILQATKHAMRQALVQLNPRPQALLLDALLLSDVALPQRSLIKGDARCLSIAAASIIAKVTRDRLMMELHVSYPLYGFNQHKGYGTPAHLTALREHGASPHHRHSFAPVRELYGLFANLDDVPEPEANQSRRDREESI